MQALRTRSDPGGAFPPLDADDRTVTVGSSANFLVARRSVLSWVDMRLGMTTREDPLGRLVAVADLARLDEIGRWARLVNCRCALPISGYRMRPADSWTGTDPCWAVGLNDDGEVAIVGAGPAGSLSPLLLDDDTVLKWLSAPQWVANAVLHSTTVRPGV